MDDHDLLLEPAKVLILNQPADRIELPPPPAKVDEAAALWRPADRPDEIERIPLSENKDDGAGLVMAAMLIGPAVELILPEKPERRTGEPRPDDDVGEDEPNNRL